MSNLFLPSSMTGYARCQAESQYPECWDGVVGYWDFSVQGAIPLLGQADDVSGNGNHGTLVVNTHSVPGKFGPALDFDGTGDYVSTGKTWADFIDADNLTFAAYVRPTGSAVESANSWVGNSILGEAAATYIAFCRTNDSGLGDKIFAMVYTTTLVEIGVDYTVDEWNHVVMTLGGGVLSIYHNGVLGDSAACGSIGSIADTMRIGFGTAYWIGQIDHVIIYNRALTAARVSFLYTHPKALVTPKYRTIGKAAAAVGGNPWNYYAQAG